MAILGRRTLVVHSRSPDGPAHSRRRASVQTIVIANPKGGSGKTTLATNVAGWLAGKRQRVVLADADPQRSATQWLKRRPPLFPAIVGQDGEARKKELRISTRSGSSSTPRRARTARACAT